MIDKIPHVFISYSWTSDAYQQRVKEIAERLIHDGIQVKLDIWDLRDGQDKYAFMEQCVTDPDIDRVLILSDSVYAEKADNRKGGVGNETTIISPEVYGNTEQQKFIPIVMERDEFGEPYLPAYLKSRMYRDFTAEHFESEYESLVRVIYNEPLERKPELGTRPSWLDKAPASLFPVKEAVKRVEYATIGKLKNAAAQDFLDIYIEVMKQFYKKGYSEPQIYIDDFMAMKEYRDVFLDYLKVFSGREHFGAFMADTFEKLYNALYNAKTYNPDAHSCGEEEFDIFRLHVWELFVCTTAFMLHEELYEDIHELLYHTYFLHKDGLSETVHPVSYESLRFYSWILEEWCKPQLSEPLRQKYTLTGHYIVTEREYLPIYSGKMIAGADLFLYQVCKGLDLDGLIRGYVWFPTLYIYANHDDSRWMKLKSRQFCKKVMPVFGVEDIDGLKERLSRCTSDPNYRYVHGFTAPAPAILDYIKIDEVGILP